jgi:sulfatase modifying factor 1
MVLMILSAAVCQAQTLRIEAFAGNGNLTYSEISDALQYHIDAAVQPNGPWSNCWAGLQPTSSGTNTVVVPLAAPAHFYRVVGERPIPGMAFVRPGQYSMGNVVEESDPNPAETPVHTNQLGAFFIDLEEVSGALWDEVCDWASTNGYDDLEGAGDAKAPDHPVRDITWYEAVKWCNARSERAGRVPVYRTDGSQASVYRTGDDIDLGDDCVLWSANGYRLPTEAEWEAAARGGQDGKRFPWGDTIDFSQANYQSTEGEESQPEYAYDLGFVPPYGGYNTNALIKYGNLPYTAPVTCLATNGYGLHHMAGNVGEWCWDWYGDAYYAVSPQVDPHGPVAGDGRVVRGGNWDYNASFCRVAGRGPWWPGARDNVVGFRTVVRAGAGSPEVGR